MKLYSPCWPSTLSRVPVQAALIVLAVATEAQAQEGGKIEQCRAIADDAARLGCYDRLMAPKRLIAGEDYQAMKLPDFVVDMEQLRGKKVSVPGIIKLVAADIAFLSSDDKASAVHVFIGTKNMPRELRMLLVTKCVSGCNALVRGKVGGVEFGFSNGIIADSFELIQ